MQVSEDWQFRTAFDEYTCIGDQLSGTTGLWEYTATLVPDEDAAPGDYDCYTEEQKEAWRNDEWCFVGIVISTRYNGIVIEQNAASLWGCDMNLVREYNSSYLTETAQELLCEAQDQSEKSLAQMKSQLNGEAS